MAWADSSVTPSWRGGLRKAALRCPEVITAVSTGERSAEALMSTLRALIRSRPASRYMTTWPEGWSSTRAVRSGSVSRRWPVHGLPAAHR